MDAVITVVLPVFAVIAAGYGTGRHGLLGRDGASVLNRFVFFVAMPHLLFVGMAEQPLAVSLNLPFLLVSLGVILGGFALIAGLALAIWRVGFERAVMLAFAATMPNTGYLGLPLFQTAFGPTRLAPAIVLTAALSVLMIGLIIGLVEGHRASARGPIGVARRIVAAMAGSPLVLAPLAGLLWQGLSPSPLPEALAIYCRLLGAAAGPCALFAVGLFLAEQRPRADSLELPVVLVVKLLVLPGVMWLGVDVTAALDPFWNASAVLLAALPTAALVFTMAQRYDVAVVESSTAVLASTVLSVGTLSWLLSRYDAAGLLASSGLTP